MSSINEAKKSPTVNYKRFEGKVALVTGSAWGMGRNHAERFAAEGAKIVLCDILGDKVKETAATLPDAIGVECDVANSSQVQKVIDAAMETYGRIDYLVNNAGGAYNAAAPFYELAEEDFDRILSMNLKGVWLFCRAVTPVMRAQGFGKIVNIASSAALRPTPGRGVYGAAKGGITSLTMTVAAELGPFGVNVNAIAPALTNVPHPKQTYSEADYEMMKAATLKAQGIKRVIEMDDMSDLVLYLCSSQSEMISGQIISMDGGR